MRLTCLSQVARTPVSAKACARVRSFTAAFELETALRLAAPAYSRGRYGYIRTYARTQTPRKDAEVHGHAERTRPCERKGPSRALPF